MTMITPSYLGETIEYSSLHACRSTLEDPTMKPKTLLLPPIAAATFLVLLIWTGSAAGAVEKLPYSFIAYPHGARPYANLIADAGGNLYGTTSAGGAHELGAVFKLTPSANGPWTQTVLHSFKGGSDGEYPLSRLVFDSAGNLYGTTWRNKYLRRQQRGLWHGF